MKYRTKLINKILAALLALALMIPAGNGVRVSAASGITGVIEASSLYLRTDAGTEYDCVKVGGENVVLTSGQEVTVLGEKNDWYHLRAVYAGTVVEGYSLSRKDGVTYISIPGDSTPEGEYATGTVTASQLNVRTGPSTDYEKLKVDGDIVMLSEGDTVKVKSESDGWYRVIVTVGKKQAEGYCKADYITVEEYKAPEPEYLYGKVNASELNVRKGPSTDYDKVIHDGSSVVFKKGQQVTIDGETDGWYHVLAEYMGAMIEGYCKADYVTLTEGTPDEGGRSDSEPVQQEEGGKTDTEQQSGSSTDDDDEPYVPVSPTDFSHGVPEGYEEKTKTYTASLDYDATVKSPAGLNLRKSASSTGKVLAVLEDGAKVHIISSRIVTTKVDGDSVKTRWFKIVADIEGTYTSGYVVSDYIKPDFGEGMEVTVKYAGQTLLKKTTSSAKVKSGGKTVKLPKGTELIATAVKTAKSGNVYYKVKGEYEGKTITGYIKAIRLTLVANATRYKVKYLALKEPDAVTEDEPAIPSDPVYSFEGANAVIKEAAGLTVHLQPSNASDILYTDEGRPVMLYTGDSIKIIDVVTDQNSTWCYITFWFKTVQYYGYIRSTHAEADSSLSLLSTAAEADQGEVDFETWLDQQGFPESYRESLRILHALYPSWKFLAFHTGYDWEEVVAKESEVGVNLIPYYRGVEWNSLATGAYSWKTDTFVVFDSPSWVTASEAAVRYYMDPRNFLDADTVFQFELLDFNPTYQNLEGVRTILKNTAFSDTTYTYTDDFGTERTTSYEETFMMAAEYTGVSPYHLASRVKQEVSVGADKVSNSVSGTVSGYEGLYNFYNIGSYHSTEVGGAIRNGLQFAGEGSSSISLNRGCMIPWNNPFKSIVGGAYYIGCNYINVGQNTLYLQKFNVTSTKAFWHQYMANIEAPYSEGVRVSKGYAELGEFPLVFSIPVYLNMPEEVSPMPEKAYNPNNWLKTLKLTDADGNKLTLTPTFDYEADCEYNVIVGYETDKIKVKTSTVSSLAEVTSKSSFSLDVGLNKIKVKVKAENGDVRSYIIYVLREDPPEGIADEEPEVGDTGESGSEAGSEEAVTEEAGSGDELPEG